MSLPSLFRFMSHLQIVVFCANRFSMNVLGSKSEGFWGLPPRVTGNPGGDTHESCLYVSLFSHTLSVFLSLAFSMNVLGAKSEGLGLPEGHWDRGGGTPMKVVCM